MPKSHAAGWDLEAPTPAQLKELFAQIESGRITRPRLQGFLRGGPARTLINEAVAVIGEKCFFGPVDWIKYLGNKSLPDSVFTDGSGVSVPWNVADIMNPGIPGKHYLFWGFPTIEGKDLDLKRWISLSEAHRNFPEFVKESLKWFYMDGKCEARWYLMPFGGVIGSANRSYERQLELLPSSYEVPTFPERLMANMLCYLKNKCFIDLGEVRTKFRADQGISGRMRVTDGKLELGGTIHDAHPDLSIAASRLIM